MIYLHAGSWTPSSTTLLFWTTWPGKMKAASWWLSAVGKCLPPQGMALLCRRTPAGNGLLTWPCCSSSETVGTQSLHDIVRNIHTQTITLSSVFPMFISVSVCHTVCEPRKWHQSSSVCAVSAGKWAYREELISCRTAGSVRDMIISITHSHTNISFLPIYTQTHPLWQPPVWS